MQRFLNSARRRVSRGCCGIRIGAARRGRCSPKSITGSPKASIQPTLTKPKHCSTNWETTDHLRADNEEERSRRCSPQPTSAGPRVKSDCCAAFQCRETFSRRHRLDRRKSWVTPIADQRRESLAQRSNRDALRSTSCWARSARIRGSYGRGRKSDVRGPDVYGLREHVLRRESRGSDNSA